MPNPYAAGGMVTDPKMFFGREDILRTITTRLAKKQSTSVVGQRRIGKSSLLYHLAHHVPLPQDSRLALLYVDMQRARFHTAAGFFTGVLSELDARVGNTFKFRDMTTSAQFDDAVERMNKAGLTPVLLLDEFERFTDHPDQFDDEFFEQMRAVGEAGKVAFVTATQLTLGELTSRFSMTSPFYNIFVQADLGLLGPTAARDLIREPMKREGLTPDKTAVNLALGLGGRHPFYLQMACALIFDALERGPLDSDDVRRRFMTQAEQHFAGLWKHLTGYERAALLWITGDVLVTPPTRALETLERRGIVEYYEGKPRIFSPTFDRAMRERLWTLTVPEPRISSAPLDDLESALSHRQAATPLHVEKAPAPEPQAVRPPLPQPTATPPQVEKTPAPQSQMTPPLYAYALVALASLAVISVLLSLLLPPNRFWQVIVVLSIVLTFTLVGGGKLTGLDFVKWLGGVLKLWK